MGEFRYSFGEFPTPDMPIYNDFLIDDYTDDVKKLKNISTVGIVYVQVYHTEKETGICLRFISSQENKKSLNNFF